MPIPVLLSNASLAPEQRARLAAALHKATPPIGEAAVTLLATLIVCGWRSPWPGYVLLGGLTLAVAAARLFVRRAVFTAGGVTPDGSAGRFTAGACAAALLWGATSLCVLLRGTDVQLQLLVLMAQAGWLGGAAVRNAASPAAVIGQSLCALLPTLAGLLLARPGFVQATIPFVLLQLAATLGIARFLGGQIMSLMLSEQRLAGANAQLVRLSARDDLTGVANRRGFDIALQVEWGRAAREASDLALLLIDVDYFVAYNKLYRALGGDDCLCRISDLLSDTVRRPTDLAARFGGPMFAALLPGTSEQGARDVAERLRRAVEHAAMPHGGSKLNVVTVSIGVASMAPQPGSDAQLLVTLADRALYDAKHGGRNQVRCAAARLPLDTWHARRPRHPPPATRTGADAAPTGESMPIAATQALPAKIPAGLRVLVLEDDKNVSLLLEDMLGELGCRLVGPCDSSAAALSLMQTQAPQVALLDVHLGAGQDGYAVAGALAARQVPFAFVTGDGAARLPEAFADRPVLQKPFHLATMVRMIADLAQRAAA